MDRSAVMKIGTTIRAYRLQKGLSQGDIEKKTGLLRCYLSRVENGHTVPSLDTLSKIALALDLPIAQFFASDTLARQLNTQNLSDDELRFLTQIRRYSSNLNESDRKLLLAMVKKFAATAVDSRFNSQQGCELWSSTAIRAYTSLPKWKDRLHAFAAAEQRLLFVRLQRLVVLRHVHGQAEVALVAGRNAPR